MRIHLRSILSSNVHTGREAILDFHHANRGKELPNVSFREYSERFLNKKKAAESSASTITRYKNVIKSFIEWKVGGVTDLDAITAFG